MENTSEKIPDSKPPTEKLQQKSNSRNTTKTIESTWLYFKSNHLAILALAIALIGGLPTFEEWWQTTRVVGTPISISYNINDNQFFLRGNEVEYKKGVRYFARANFKALNKSYHISDVRVFITLKPGEVKEGIFNRGSPPPPNSDTLNIQYLRSLEKDKNYLCDIIFFLEGEHKNSIAEIAFDKIEIRLYDNDGRYKKVNLYHSDFPEF